MVLLIMTILPPTMQTIANLSIAVGLQCKIILLSKITKWSNFFHG